MKVFRINEYDWVCADNEEQAKEWYHDETGVDTKDIEEDFIGEVSLDEMMWVGIDDVPEHERNNFKTEVKFGEIWCHVSFDWVIKNESITEPCIISSTEY